MMHRAFWPCWLLASATTGIVGGFMLGHVLILGRLLDWMLAKDPALLAATYPAFARAAGREGLTIFYAICGLQVLAGLAFLAVALGGQRHRLGAAIAASAAALWPIVHYASGFGAVEAQVLRSVTPVAAEVAARFLAANLAVHLVHAALLLTGLVALLAIPLAETRPPSRQGARM
jgi:hypothetical protein